MSTETITVLTEADAAARGLLYTQDILALSAKAGRPIVTATFRYHQQRTAAKLAAGTPLDGRDLPAPAGYVRGRKVTTRAGQNRIVGPLSPVWDRAGAEAWVAAHAGHAA